MRLPDVPDVRQLTQLSASLYEALLMCRARAAWLAFGSRGMVPQHPKGLLGTCVHTVLQRSQSGAFSGSEGEIRAAARVVFDQEAKELYDRAHPLMRAKFSAPERMPYYYLFRERAALLATRIHSPPSTVGGRRSVSGRDARQPTLLIETTMRSRDGLLAGRPDHIDGASGEVLDFKTGTSADDASEISEAEARQLRFYAYLGSEAEMALTKGVIIRGDGTRLELEVPEGDAVAEGERARDSLQTFNSHVAGGFEQLAQPAPRVCRYCPCIPFCEPFWRSVDPSWIDLSGPCVEGTINQVHTATVQGTELLTIDIAVTRGNLSPRTVTLQHLPLAWACADGSPTPGAGDVVRIVGGSVSEAPQGPTIILPNRVATAFWTVSRAERPAENRTTARGEPSSG